MLGGRPQWGEGELERRLSSQLAWQGRLGVTTPLVPSRDPGQQGNRGRSEPPALCLQGLSERKRPGLQGVQEKCLCAQGD